MTMKTCRCTFRIGCVITALSTALWPLYLFSLDEDLVQIDFKEFHSTEDRLYPALTLCFDRTTFYKADNSATNDLGIDQQRKVFSNQPLKIEDYINNIVVKDMKNHETRFTRTRVNIEAEGAMKGKRLSMDAFLRHYQSTSCFAVGIPFKKKKGINSIDVGIRKDIFKRRHVPTSNQIVSGKSQLTVALSYQNQIFPLLNRDAKELKSNDPLKNDCSGLVFKIREMEILRRRNKPSHPCNDYDNEDAINVLSDAASRLGCMPKGWNIPSILPGCQEKDLNQSARKLLDDGIYIFLYYLLDNLWLLAFGYRIRLIYHH